MFNSDLVERCLMFIAREVRNESSLAGVIGVQISDLTLHDDSAKAARYIKVLNQLSIIDSTLPIYVSDNGNLGEALEWSLVRNMLDGKQGTPVFISTNKSYINNDAVKDMSPNELISSIPSSLHQINRHNSGSVTDLKGATATYVNEYSCAMPDEVWEKGASVEKSDIIIQFGRYQTRRWHEKASGSAFWAWNGNKLKSKGCDFRTQVDTGSIYCPSYLSLTENQVRQSLADADLKRSQLMTTAIEKHIAYFEKVGGRYEHWRYADGWHLGFTDARAFFASRVELFGSVAASVSLTQDSVVGADRIGALDLWVLKRMREEDSVSRDKCEFVWEWEHGFRAGVRTFYKIVGIHT